jgi:tetratricopeptide (TPR) repeat protein
MRILPLAGLILAVSAIVSVAVHALLRPPAAAAETPAAAGAGDAASAELLREVQALRAEVAALRGAGAPAADGVVRAPALDDLVEQAVAQALAARDAAAVEAAVAAEPAFSVEGALGRLLDPMLGYEDREAVWQEALDSGQMETLIAALEARAAADPDNVALRFELGYAYLQPILTGAAPGPQAAPWAMKSDAAFDQVLALDPEHWDARFNKAVSYTFWPPIMGKQQAAISHFETLVAQQGRSAPRPEFAQTYLFLGNLYEQTGQGERAREVWSQGFGLFPDSAELRERLGP